MTPRGTDWSLASLVALGFATGVLSLFSGGGGSAWVFAVHGILGAALGLLLVWKLRRVGRRIMRPGSWDRRTRFGLAALALVATALASGWLWASGGDLLIAGYNLLGWHMALGTLLALFVLLHAALRARPIRGRDVANRRQFLEAAGIAAGAVVAWRLQRPMAGLFGLRGAERRFTGSYEADSFAGNPFPTTSWVADDPRPLRAHAYRLEVSGRVATPLAVTLAELDGDDEVVATLDCTGGFYSTQRWRGTRLGRLIERAGADAAARHVRVVSRTGYRWSFSIDAHDLLLATRVGGEPISHGHGAPLRLVAPNRRGFQWVKWVVRIELHEGSDPGALPSTIWSSFTAEGRGAS